jgi:hypothetical protein
MTHLPYNLWRYLCGFYDLVPFFIMFSILYWPNLRLQILVALPKLSMMKHQQKPNWKLKLPSFSCDYGKCMFVDPLTKFVYPPNYVYIACGIVDQIQIRSLISCNMCLHCVCSLILPNHTPITYRCPIKESNWISPKFISISGLGLNRNSYLSSVF